MHTSENIQKVLLEELAYQEKEYAGKTHTIDDYIYLMAHYAQAAKLKIDDGGFLSGMDALDHLRRVVALGISAMKQHGYTRQYDRHTKRLPN